MTAGPVDQESGSHANLQHWLEFFCSSAVTESSLGVIKPLTAEEACGFLGCMVVETGEPELENLDVIEAGSGAGRGAMQYTGVRRTAYDAARLQAIAEGIDPNSNSWQELYFAEEYAGLHDPPQGSLIGWTGPTSLRTVPLAWIQQRRRPTGPVQLQRLRVISGPAHRT